MKLSVVIICWNDRGCILECIDSVYAQTKAIDFEIIVSDNASSDDSVAAVRKKFPQVRIVENQVNLGFGGGNNAGFRAAQGEYVMILNPDTIIRDRALEKLVTYADRHPEAGAFGCRVLNVDGSLQRTAHPPITILSSLARAFWLWWLGRWWNGALSDRYIGWDCRTEREIGFQAACCLLIRTPLLKMLNGFDERFFHQLEDADLCRRVWDSGHSILFFPDAEITHIGGQNRGTYPIKVILETERSKYRYFYKYYGRKGVILIRYISLFNLGLRYLAYRFSRLLSREAAIQNRLNLYRVVWKWHWRIDPVRFAERGEEPDVGYAPLATPPGTVPGLQQNL